MIGVFLAEDHETVREGLRLLVNAQEDMRVVGEAGDGKTAIEQAQALKPNVVVLDLSMPHVNGVVAAQTLHASLPSAAVVTLTRHRDNAYVQQLLAAGASAYVLKQSSSKELLKAIRAAASGQKYLDTALQVPPAIPRPKTATPSITERETAVLRMTAVGHSNKQIAARLGIAVKTVEVHKSNAMRKLDLTGRTDVVRYAAMQGWLQDP
ncbi:MAG TPA: response regulator transcription factor [Vicinamibacterales bacterium]|nr:response regulator transcription factor [Vicinamibacterales bacterium]